MDHRIIGRLLIITSKIDGNHYCYLDRIERDVENPAGFILVTRSYYYPTQEPHRYKLAELSSIRVYGDR